MLRILLTIALFLSVLIPPVAEGQEISGPEVRFANNDVYVSFSLVPGAKYIEEIKDGIDKELKLYIDLFRVWKVWPDEFVLGKFYSRRMKVDPIKKEYVATSFDGNVIIERRFRSFETMLVWTLSVKDLKLTNTRELEPGQYFVRITAESKIRNLPPMIRQFFVFLSENEFKVRKDSGVFVIEGGK
ncbi:MAG: DUF4390 domain-containing protein [Thermodesulfovibrionales bacterium]